MIFVVNKALPTIFKIGLLSVLSFFAGCSANEEILKSNKQSPTQANVESPQSTVDQEIESMRTADFRYIWIIRRKDGAVMDSADKAIIRQNTVEMNRRVVAEEVPCSWTKEELQDWEKPDISLPHTCPKAVIIGSNAVPFKENFDALSSAFAIQDVSPEPVPSPLPTFLPAPPLRKDKHGNPIYR